MSAPPLSGSGVVPAGPSLQGALALPQAHTTGLLSPLPRRPAALSRAEGGGRDGRPPPALTSSAKAGPELCLVKGSSFDPCLLWTLQVACQCRRRKRPGFNPWVGRILWRRAWQPPPVFLPGASQGRRSYSLWGCRVRHA